MRFTLWIHLYRMVTTCSYIWFTIIGFIMNYFPFAPFAFSVTYLVLMYGCKPNHNFEIAGHYIIRCHACCCRLSSSSGVCKFSSILSRSGSFACWPSCCYKWHSSRSRSCWRHISLFSSPCKTDVPTSRVYGWSQENKWLKKPSKLVILFCLTWMFI